MTMKLTAQLRLTIFSVTLASLASAQPAEAASILSGPVVNPANGHSYYLLTSDYWEPSEAAAVELGGHLVTINDQGENDWVFDTFASLGGQSRTLWTGYHRLSPGGAFVWVSGETPGFINWYPGEPNNARGDENYAAFVPPAQDPVGKTWFDMFPDTNYFWYGPIYGVVEVSADSDEDGILDRLDACPLSDLASTIVVDGCDSGITNTLSADGCTSADLVANCGKSATNHSQFASCVAHLIDDWKKAKLITGKQGGALQSCAAKSRIP
jgi:hypothetical protein